jgi:TnpA family transposase
MLATSHEAPYVLDGLMHHGAGLRIGTHYTDTGGASDHVFILCAMLGFQFCPRLRDLPDRRLACIEPAMAYSLQPTAYSLQPTAYSLQRTRADHGAPGQARCHPRALG